MTTELTTPATAPPPDPALAGLRARVYDAISQAARTLGVAPISVWMDQTSRGRQGQLRFDNVNAAGAWASWLHWPWSATGRDGRYELHAYGQWLGFSWVITGSEPLVPVPAPAHREA